MELVDHWNCATKLPTPGIDLVVENMEGDILTAQRPSYLANVEPEMLGDLGYRDRLDRPVHVRRWRYK